MKQTVAMFKTSSVELKSSKCLTFSAMLMAISVILASYSILLTPAIKISFKLIPVAIGGILYGPIVGATLGGAADILGYLVYSAGGAFFPGFTISAILTGMLFGLVLYKKPFTITRVIVANILVSILVNLLLNTYWLHIMQGVPFLTLIVTRLVKEGVMLVINILILFSLTKLLKSTIMK